MLMSVPMMVMIVVMLMTVPMMVMIVIVVMTVSMMVMVMVVVIVISTIRTTAKTYVNVFIIIYFFSVVIYA